MRTSRSFTSLVVAASLSWLSAPASAQMVAGPPPNMHSFSPVHGAQPMMGGMSGMSAQQMQMAQLYMLYGMMGMGGRGNVATGVANPFVGGGFGAGSLPSLDNSGDYGPSNSKQAGQTGRDELRAQRAEQKRQAKLAKANAAANKAAGKAKGKKNAAAVQ